MNHQEGFFEGVRGSRIYYQSWTPEGDAKAVLLIAHGLAEHSGRYMNVVNHFVPLGYAVYGIDYLGHGKSDGPRTFVQTFDDYLNTLETYHSMVEDWQPSKPIFLVGHSMGGLVAPLFVLAHGPNLAGMIISGPASKVPDYVSQLVIFMGKLLSTILPKVGVQSVDADGVSRDPVVVQAYENDPLVYRGKATARLAAELLKAMERLRLEAAEIVMPVLIMQGSEDKLVDPDGAQLLHDIIGSSDKTLKIYPGLYHEIFNEPERNQVFADMQAWLEEHI
jgi:alpha-beta hydrolase superfamily lysophospholipase